MLNDCVMHHQKSKKRETEESGRQQRIYRIYKCNAKRNEEIRNTNTDKLLGQQIKFMS